MNAPQRTKILVDEEPSTPAELERQNSARLSQQAQNHLKYLKRSSILYSDRYLSSDQVLERIAGPSGRFQIYLLIMASIQFNLSGITFYGIGFLEKDPTYICENGQVCSKDEACASGVFSTEYRYHNIIEQYNLQCSSQTKIGMIAACYFFGFLLGSIFFPRLADIIGRKPVGLIGILAFMVLIFLITVNESLIVLYVLMILLGLRTPTTTQVCYIHLLEYVGQKYRNKYATGLLIVDGLAAFWTPFYFEGVHDFKPLFYFAICLAALLFCCNICFFPESARYYITRGNYQKAKKLFFKISVINKVDLSRFRYSDNSSISTWSDIRLKGEEATDEQVIDLDDEISPQNVKIINQKAKNSTSFRQFLKGGCRKVLCPLGIMAVNWFVVNFISYGQMLGIKNIHVDLFYLGLAIGIAEVLSYFLSGLLGGYVGRKISLISLYLVTFICCIIYQILLYDLSDIAIIVIILISKLAITAAFALVYLITSELFPTVYRGTTFGITNIVGRVGGILAPIVDELQKGHFMLIFGISALVALVLTLCLRETKGKDLKDTLQEMGTSKTEM